MKDYENWAVTATRSINQSNLAQKHAKNNFFKAIASRFTPHPSPSFLFKVRYSPFTRKSFTLAEVLITLGIIGVVAGMTIPTLMHNIQKQELKTASKEAYSIVESAYTRLLTDGGYANNDSGLYNYYLTSSNTAQFAIDFTNYLNVQQNFGSFGSISFAGKVTSTGQYYKDFLGDTLGNSVNVHYVGQYQYGLKNGMIVFFQNPASTAGLGLCVDINGYKNPNTLGEDVLCFYVTNKSTLIPVNTIWGHPTICNTANANTSRFGCPNAAFFDDTYWNL